MKKPFIYKPIIFIIFFCFNTIYLFSQCGFVGTLNYPGGPINAGSQYLVNLQVYQAGVTEAPGQGANIS